MVSRRKGHHDGMALERVHGKVHRRVGCVTVSVMIDRVHVLGPLEVPRAAQIREEGQRLLQGAREHYARKVNQHLRLYGGVAPRLSVVAILCFYCSLLRLLLLL